MTAAEVTKDLESRLRTYTGTQGMIILFNVGDGAGFGNKGWSDAIAMQTWPSKGLAVHGFEIKASRQDWLRELGNTEKNKRWQGMCHKWFIVAPKEIVKLDELPVDWGLLIPSGAMRLRIAKRSDRDIKERGVPLALMAAVFRAAGGERDKRTKVIEDGILEQHEAANEARIGQAVKDARDWQAKYNELASALGRFESHDILKKRAEAMKSLSAQDILAEVQHALARSRRVVKALEDTETGLVE